MWLFQTIGAGPSSVSLPEGVNLALVRPEADAVVAVATAREVRFASEKLWIAAVASSSGLRGR
jgi:hypothetical protein